MKSGSANRLDLIERRLDLLRSLVHLGEEWRAAFIGLNMERSERCVADEELLCEQILALDRQIAMLESKHDKAAKGIVEVDSAINPKIRASLGRTQELQLELNRSNQIRRAILKRSRFTMSALRNLFNSYAPTYGSPAALSTGTIYEESV